jgi:hypothetical protein
MRGVNRDDRAPVRFGRVGSSECRSLQESPGAILDGRRGVFLSFVSASYAANFVPTTSETLVTAKPPPPPVTPKTTLTVVGVPESPLRRPKTW